MIPAYGPTGGVSDMEIDFTRKFSLNEDRGEEIKAILTAVYNALQEK